MAECKNEYYDRIINMLDDYNAGKLSFEKVSRIPMKDVQAARAYVLQKTIHRYMSIKK
ncbi:MAG: hypothetical protein AAF149_13655 [Bacteroidota bacterium]